MTEPVPTKRPKAKPTGITVRTNSKGVKAFRAEAWDNAARKAVYKTFPSMAAAKSWRAAMQTKIKSGEAGAVEAMTLRYAADEWMTKARAGIITTRDGTYYKPATLRAYRSSLDGYVLPALGHRKLTEIHIGVVQDFADQLAAKGLARASIRTHIAPLRVIFNDALLRRRVHVHPVGKIKIGGAAEVPRDRIATGPEAATLLAALKRDRTLWATAFYAGLRCGELMALDWSCVDLVERRIRVQRSYDPKEHAFVAVKSQAGQRTVPFPDLLLPFLTGEDRTEGLVFGRDGVTPFGYTGVRKRALKEWATVTCGGCEAVQVRAGALCACGAVLPDPLEPITLHECRHTYVSLMLAAGVDTTKVSKWTGHSSITITVDRYGHLVPGDERGDMERFEAYLNRPA